MYIKQLCGCLMRFIELNEQKKAKNYVEIPILHILTNRKRLQYV